MNHFQRNILQSDRRRKIFPKIIAVFSGFSACIAISTLLLICIAVTWRGLEPMLKNLSSVGIGDLGFQLLGTLILITTAAVFAIPVGLAAGFFVAEFGRTQNRWAGWLEWTLFALNGLPSILYGLLGFFILVKGLGLEKSWLSGGMILGIMILPTVAVSVKEAALAIPDHYREAAAALGLSREKILRTVIIPQSLHGLWSGLLTGLARAAGETAPILFTAVVVSGATFPKGIVDEPILALPYHIFVMAQDAFQVEHIQSAWHAALLLIIVVGMLGFASLPLRRKVHEEASV